MIARYLPVTTVMQERPLVGAVGAMALVLGGALACAAEHVPARAQLLEGGGGVLLLAGLALIGSVLPFSP
jgi:hypothetical protein